MKKILILISFILTTGIAFSQQPANYISPKFKSLATTHQELAILPFDFRLELTPNRYELLDINKLKDLELKESKEAQRNIEQYLQKKKVKKGFKVTFQTVEKTNQLLEENNITHENIAQFTRKQLIDILGVDGIIYGSISATQLISYDRALLYSVFTGYSPNTNYSDMTIKVADASNGEIIWNYATTQGGSLGSSQVSLVENMLKRAARKFPYKRL